MKVRNGFVSNSSSSSFIMLIPESFNIDEFDFTPYQKKLGYNDTNEEEVIKLFKKLQKQKSLWHGDNYDVITEIFDEFVITSVETSSEDGGVDILSNKSIKKLKKLLDA